MDTLPRDFVIFNRTPPDPSKLCTLKTPASSLAVKIPVEPASSLPSPSLQSYMSSRGMARSRRRNGVPSVPAAVLLVARRLSMVHADSVSPAFVLPGGGADAAFSQQQLAQQRHQRRSLAPTLSTATR